jgi:hypothetical protein
MGMNTFRNQPDGGPPPAVYWRRRFLALVAGLAILAVIAWAFSGVLAAPGSGRAAAAKTGTHGASSPRVIPSATPSATAPETASPSGTPSPTPAQTSDAVASGLPRHCRPSQIVLSVFPSRSSYRHGQPPQFDVDVVSTAARTCAFNVGPKFLALVVTVGGKRVWSSADCVHGRGSLITNLARGVPTVLPVSWNRERSGPGCQAASHRVRPGHFAAIASDGGTSSNPVSFRLR